MKIAVIDIGTNTFNLLIAEKKGLKQKTLYRTRIPVKLGRGGITRNRITPAAFRRGIAALKKYKKKIEKYGAEKTIAFATSAVRDAVNGKAFTEEAQKKTGIAVHIIAGNREAELIYRGVRQAVPLTAAPVLIMDIGGGSTEFIIANRKKIFWKKSFHLGVTRMLETFAPSNPLAPRDIISMTAFFCSELEPLFKAIRMHKPDIVAGSAGSFDTFAELIAKRFHPPGYLKGKRCFKFSVSEFEKIRDWLVASSLRQRLKKKTIVNFRADTIHLAAILVSVVLEKISIKKMWRSKFSLREGMLEHYFA